MSGILDLHTVMALQRGFGVYAGDLAAFRALFSGVDQDVVDAWHAKIAADLPTITASAPVKKAGLPRIVVTLASEHEEIEPLGGSAFDDDDDLLPRAGAVVKQEVNVLVLAPNPEIARALFVTARAIMLLSDQAFVAAGYTDLHYDSGRDLATEAELVAEALGAYARVLTFSARSTLILKNPTDVIASKSWYVLASDLTLDGYAGGVLPSEV